MTLECTINDEVPLPPLFEPLPFLRAACAAKQITSGSISISFVSPEKIVELNQLYLKRDYVTDIISFNLSVPSEPIEGDIYICLEQAAKNAKEYNQTLEDELKLLIVHGVLHLLGYADYTEEEKLEMRHQENQLLTQIQHGYSSL